MSNSIFPAQVRGLAYTVVKTQENSVIVKDGSNYLTNRLQQNFNPRWHWRLEYSVLFDTLLNPNPNLTYSDLQTMIGFCQSKNGTFEDFLYLDPDDNSVGPGVITAGWLANHPYMLGAVIVVSGTAWQVSSAPAGARSGFVQPSFSTDPTNDGGLAWSQLGSVTGSGWPNPQAQLQVFIDSNNNYITPIQRNLGGQFWEMTPDLYGGITVYENGAPSSNYTIGWGQSLSQYSPGLYLYWGSQPVQPVTATFTYFFRVRFEEPTNDFEKFANQLWALGGEAGVQGKGYLKLVSAPIGVVSGGLSPGGAGPPPFAFPNGATRMAILYPNSAGRLPPSSTAIPYAAGAWAGPNASGFVGTWLQGLGSSGPQIWFSTFVLPPSIPPGSVIAVYSWTPFTHTGTTNAGCAGSIFNGGTQIGSILGGFQYGTWYSLPGAFGLDQLYQQLGTQSGGWGGGNPISTFPYAAIKFFFSTGILNFTTSTDLMMPYPRLVVYY